MQKYLFQTSISIQVLVFTLLVIMVISWYHYSDRCKQKLHEEDPEVDNTIESRKPILRPKQKQSSSEGSKQKMVSTSSSSASYLTLKSHLLLMNASSQSKSNKYKRSHSSISNPETMQKEQEEEEIHSPEKISKTAPVQGNIPSFWTNMSSLKFKINGY